MAAKTHKVSGWTRTPLRDGSGCYRIVSTDGSPDRIVRFLSAGSWAGDPNDHAADQQRDRAVLVSGPPLPDWASDWLNKAAALQAAHGRAALRAAIDQADWDESIREAWNY